MDSINMPDVLQAITDNFNGNNSLLNQYEQFNKDIEILKELNIFLKELK